VSGLATDEFSVTRLSPAQVRPGSTFRPQARVTVGSGPAELASAEVGTAEVFEREPPEATIARLSWTADRRDCARIVLSAAAAQVPDRPVYFQVSASVHPDSAERVTLAEDCGFELFGEKEGFWWGDIGQPLPASAELTFQSMSRLGRASFVPVMARCLDRTLDRTDRAMVARHGPGEWVTTFLARHALPVDEESWLLATSRGSVVGFVALARRDGNVGTIAHIGVVPEARGRGYGRQLVSGALRAARAREMRGVVALVDVDNTPMMAAMLAAGASATAYGWHTWLLVRRPGP
jgi:GNAT superfamily N-acetyltransferase